MPFRGKSMKFDRILNSGFSLLLLCNYASLQYTLAADTSFEYYEENNTPNSFVNDSQVIQKLTLKFKPSLCSMAARARPEKPMPISARNALRVGCHIVQS